MGICLVGKEGRHVLVYSLGREFATLGGDYQYLVSVGFYGTGFVHVDVGRFSSNDTFASEEQGIDYSLVCLCASDEEEYFSLGHAYGLAYPCLCALGVWVGTVSRGLYVVLRYKAREYLG